MADLIGKMRKVCGLALNIPTVQGVGFRDSYGLVLNTRGYLRQQSGSRSLMFAEINSTTGWILTVRYQQDIATNISVKAKWIIDNVWYTVESWEKVDDLNGYYEFKLKKDEPVSAGAISLLPLPTGLQSPLYLSTVVNNTTVSDPSLNGATIVLVARTGVIYNLTTGAPGNFQFSFSGTTITFGTGFNNGEIVYVLYKL